MGFYFWNRALHAALAHLQQNKNRDKERAKKRKRPPPSPFTHISILPYQGPTKLIKRNGWCVLDDFQAHHWAEVRPTVLRQDNPTNIKTHQSVQRYRTCTALDCGQGDRMPTSPVPDEGNVCVGQCGTCYCNAERQILRESPSNPKKEAPHLKALAYKYP